jgi:hypothetical protein
MYTRSFGDAASHAGFGFGAHDDCQARDDEGTFRGSTKSMAEAEAEAAG